MKKREQSFVTNKLKYSLLNDNQYIITLTPQVSTSNFESVLEECYRRSKHKIIKEVVFDLSKVEFLDIFELGLTVLWILDLKKRGKEIKVEFPSLDAPTKVNICKFLEAYGFQKFLRDNQIAIDKARTSDRELYFGVEAYFSPIKFAFEKEFEGYTRSPSFLELEDADVVKDGSFKNIIIKELKDNMRKHAKDRLPYIIMTKFPRKGRKDRIEAFLKMMNVKASYGVTWEQRFFQNLLRSPFPHFFELVIGDGGPGIPKLLGKVEECKGKKEYEILDHAFEYDSTSNREAREHPMKKWIEKPIKDYKDSPPATGLYWVKQILKRYNGFLSVRTGKTILCYDFFTYPEIGRPTDRLITNRTWKLDRGDRKLRNLCSFLGTQYKMYFPIQRLSHAQKRKYFEIPLYEKVSFEFEVIRLEQYFTSGATLDQQFKALRDVLLYELGEKIKHLKGKILPKKIGVIMMDFMEISQDKLPPKALHYLIWEMMRRQNSSLIITGTNVGENILPEISLVSSKVKELGSGKEKTLTELDEHFALQLVGVSKGHEKFLEDLIDSPLAISVVPKENEKIIEKNVHLIRILDNKYSFIFPYELILREIKKILKDKIKDYILQAQNFIFHTDTKVKIPDRYYVEGFFELYKLVENNYWKNKLQKYIECELKLLNPSVIISVGRNSKPLLEAVDIGHREWIHIDNPLDSRSLPYAKRLTIDKSEKICIITELIGTGESLGKILGFLENYTILKILTNVDARENANIEETEFKYNGKTFDLESIVRCPLKYFIKTKPPHWSYEEIRSVDLSTNVLIVRPILPPEKTLWKGMGRVPYKIKDDLVEDYKNPFLEEVVRSTDSIIRGHFTTKSNKHITYFFLVKKIAEDYAREIAERIAEDIQQFREKESIKISHILYPEYNPGVKSIVDYVAHSLSPDMVVRGININEISNILAERNWNETLGKVEGAIIFDDSYSTGFTVERLIDIAYKSGPPKFIFSYILMDRADFFTSHFLSSLSAYGVVKGQTEIRIRRLSDAQIPVYDVLNCPICRYVQKLRLLTEEMIKSKLENKRCIEFLEEEINKWKTIDIEELQNLIVLNAYFAESVGQRTDKCILRWKLEIAKTQMGSRNELARKVAEYKEEPHSVLNLLNVIFEEFLYFFEIERNAFGQVFYKSFREKLKEACKFFSKDSKILCENLGPIIITWYFIDVEDFFGHLDKILQSLIIQDTNLFWKAIVYVLIGECITEDKYTNKIIDALTTLLHHDSIQVLPEENYNLKATKEYLERKTEEIVLPSIYRSYRDAINAPYYFAQNYGYIREKIEEGNLEQAKHLFGESTLHIKTNFQGIEYLLKSEILRSSEKIKHKEFYNKLKNIVDSYESLQIRGDIKQVDFERMVEGFKANIEEIRELLGSTLRCDLSETIESVLSQDDVKEIFRTHRIEVPKKPVVGPGAGYAFIRKHAMKRILIELLANLRYAFEGGTGNNKAKILTRKIQSGEFLALEILDNGILPEWEPGGGFTLISSLVNEFGGRFYPLIKISPIIEAGREGYTKKSMVYLVNIRKPQEMVK